MVIGSMKKIHVVTFIIVASLVSIIIVVLRYDSQQTVASPISTLSCSLGEQNNTTAGCALAGAETGSSAVGTGITAPDFTLPTLNGTDITLSHIIQDKPVILDFWTSWCPNCRRDMPRLNALSEKYHNQVEVIGVNLQESPTTVQGFIQSAAITYPIAFDTDGAVARLYGIQYTNTHVLINTQGSIVKVILGDISEDDIEALIQS